MRENILFFILVATLAIGCDKLEKQVQIAPDSVDNIHADERDFIFTGTVFIGDPGDRFGTDTYVLESATLTEDTLNIRVSFSGGCQNHQFTLIASDTFIESVPVQLAVVIAHNANGDTCEAYPTENYRFDLTPIKRRYQNAYRQDTGTLILRLKDAPAVDLVYEF